MQICLNNSIMFLSIDNWSQVTPHDAVITNQRWDGIEPEVAHWKYVQSSVFNTFLIWIYHLNMIIKDC